ncbi:MAG: response regulator [Anaerolineae bacterium]|nr:response regulator [Anaerolineae bacterium]
MFNKKSAGNESRDVIKVVIVDDIPDTRENIKKLLAFEEQEFRVVGTAGTGTEAVRIVQETQPDVVIMDINMPDMDGIQATSQISKVVPTAAVIIMSVQQDSDYFRKAMLAGARNYLIKPVDPDELYGTIRAVYKQHEIIRRQQAAMQGAPGDLRASTIAPETEAYALRAGHIIVVYSPQGGVGCTTIATNIATGLMKKGIRVLLVDANLQFGDVGVFLKLQSQSNLYDLVDKIDDLDIEFFDSVVSSHESGLKVLLGPPRLELALEVEQVPNAVGRILEKVAQNYDFVVVDTSSHLNESQLALFDMATKVVLVSTPTLASIKNTRFVLDLFDKLNYTAVKTTFVLNRVEDERQRGARVTIPTETIEKHLKRPVDAQIPADDRTVLSAVNKGVPVISYQRDRTRSPIKELVELADSLFAQLAGDEDFAEDDTESDKNKAKKPLLRLGR